MAKRGTLSMECINQITLAELAVWRLPKGLGVVELPVSGNTRCRVIKDTYDETCTNGTQQTEN